MQPNDTILITGGTGFVGSHLYEHLIEHGYSNIVLTTLSRLTEKNQAFFSAATIQYVNLTDTDAVFRLFAEVQPKWIFHLASLAATSNSFENRQRIYSNNIDLQSNVLEAMRQYTPQARLLSVSSGEVYGKSFENELPISESHPLRPMNPYAVSKIAQDYLAYMYYLSYELDIVRVRPFNHIGERQTNAFAIASFAEQIAKVELGQQQTINVGNIDAIRDFTDVKDVVNAYRILMERGISGEIYNIGSGQGILIKEMLEMLIKLSNREIPLETDKTRLRPSDIPVMIANIEKIKKLGWQPTIGIKETLQRVLEFWRKTV